MTKRKSNKAGKILKALVAAIFIFTVIGSMDGVLAENNWQNKPISLYYNGDGGDVSPNKEEKMDTTPSYAYNQGTCGFRVCIYASNLNGGFIKETTTGASSYRYILVGKDSYLHTQTYEWGYRWCRLVITPDVHTPIWIKGQWSPDSKYYN